MLRAEDYILHCIDKEKAIKNHEMYWCSVYDEGFDFIDEYCFDCVEYQKLISKMLPKINEILNGKELYND